MASVLKKKLERIIEPARDSEGRYTTRGLGNKGKPIVVTLLPGFASGEPVLEIRTKGCRDKVSVELAWVLLKMHERQAQQNRKSRPGAARRKSTLRL